MSAFKTQCVTQQEWVIDDYRIVEERCIGYAGPYFYPIHLYKDKREIAQHAYKSDSCLVEFTGNDGDTLKFDLCSKTLVKVTVPAVVMPTDTSGT